MDIDAPEAWGVTIGSSSTIIAVLDTGVDQYNPDLAGHLWTNPNPYGDQGFYDDIHGWNFVSNTNNVQDDDGHGTHVTGIIAAWSNNGFGVSGVNWNAQIMPVKVLDSQGNGTTDATVAGIYYAVQHGAKVINASWGGGAYSQAMLDALNYANSQGVVFVAAAGNGSGYTGLGTSNDAIPEYPASYRTPNEIVVAAVDSSGNLASFSNYGPNTVDLAAPGVNILSTYPESMPQFGAPQGFDWLSGTSMATPYVTGVVSLVAGLHPNWTAAQLLQQVLDTVKPLPGLTGKVATGGMVDAYNAVANVYTATASPTPVGPNGLITGGSSDGDVLASILASSAYGTQVGGTNSAFVNGVFEAELGRAADPGSLNFFEGLLATGTPRFTVAQIVVNTPEGRLAQVARWYQQYFGYTKPLWQLESDPSVQFWAGVISTNGENAALAGLLSTSAYINSQGGTTGFLRGAFWDVFGRTIDPGSFAYFNGLLQQGVSPYNVVRILQGTPEAKEAMVAQWYQQDFGWTSPLAVLKSNPTVTYWAGFLGNF